MGLKTTFKKGAELLFKKFKDAVKSGTYYSITDDGFDTNSTSFTVRVIEESFNEKDIKYLSFSDLIQPNDVKGILLGVDLPAELHSQIDKLDIIQEDSSVKTYTIVSFDRDPLSIVYTILLRKT